MDGGGVFVCLLQVLAGESGDLAGAYSCWEGSRRRCWPRAYQRQGQGVRNSHLHLHQQDLSVVGRSLVYFHCAPTYKGFGSCRPSKLIYVSHLHFLDHQGSLCQRWFLFPQTLLDFDYLQGDLLESLSHSTENCKKNKTKDRIFREKGT